MLMKPLVLFCKSYSTDLNRVIRLAQSVQRYNTEKIPFHVSVPAADLPLFRHHLDGLGVALHADAEIIQASPGMAPDILDQLPGSLTQQIIKSEFWRLGLSASYLCLDSDAFFIRPFGTADFLAPDGTPYSVIDEGHEILEDAVRHKKNRVLAAFREDAQKMQDLFERPGRQYNFGPLPVVWHRAVWASLHERYLTPRGMSLADAIMQAPAEARWYGEALLRYQAIRLVPCQALFKVYHYAWQLDQDRRNGIGEAELAALYCGVIYQSAWERELDWPQEGGGRLSRTGRRIRRWLGRI